MVQVNTIQQVTQQAAELLAAVVQAAACLVVVMVDRQDQERPDKVTTVQAVALLGIQVAEVALVQQPHRRAVRSVMVV